MKYPLFSALVDSPGGPPVIETPSEMESGVDSIPAMKEAGPEPAFVPENARQPVKSAEPPKTPDLTPEKPVEAPKDVEPAKAEESPKQEDEFGSLRKGKKESVPQQAATASDPKTPKELREAYALTKKERDELKAKVDELARAKEDGTRAEIEKAKSELKAEVDSLRKKYEEAETKTRYLDYKSSDEYVEKFEIPIKNAWQAAMRDLKGVRVLNSDGTDRDATPQDIAALAQMDPGPAWKAAKEMFGDLAPEVMGHRKEILRLNEARDSAIEHWKTKGSELQQQERKQAEELHSRLVQTFDERQQELRKSAPDLFDVPGEDKEASDYASKAEAMNALAFKGQGLRDGISADERRSLVTRAQADIAARNRSWPYHVLRANRAEAEVERLKSEIAKLRGTEPAPGGGNIPASDGGKKSSASVDDITSGIDDIPAIGRA